MIYDFGSIGFGMARGADDQSLFGRRTNFGKSGGAAVKAEINYDITLPNDRTQIVALIDLADNLQFRNFRGATDERLAHAAFGTGDDDAGHTWCVKRDV